MTKHRGLCEREARSDLEEDGMLELERFKCCTLKTEKGSTSQEMPMASRSQQGQGEGYPSGAGRNVALPIL